MDDKGFVFTMDVLLALIVITMAIGIAVNQFEGLNYQLQDFTGRQTMEKTVNDAADYLVKNPGTPTNWEKMTSLPTNYLPGLAHLDTATTPDSSNVFPVSNYLDSNKMVALGNLQVYNQHPLSRLVNTDNYYLKIVSLDTSFKYLEVGTDPSTLNPSPKEIAVANRTVSLIPGDVLLRLTDLAHLNPTNPSNNTFLWYYNTNNGGKGGGKPAIYIGPSTNDYLTTNASLYITQNDINNYDYYIRVDVNQGGGSGVSAAFYGFTSGNWAVNGSYGTNGYIGYDPRTTTTSDDKRETAIEGELSYINGNGNNGFIKINNNQLNAGNFIYVNNVLNTTYNARGNPYYRLWFRVPSDANADFSISLVRTNKGQNLNKVPAQLVLKIWE